MDNRQSVMGWSQQQALLSALMLCKRDRHVNLLNELMRAKKLNESLSPRLPSRKGPRSSAFKLRAALQTVQLVLSNNTSDASTRAQSINEQFIMPFK